MSKRDDFTEKTKRRLALRANHQCSFRSCPQPTSGPSEEAPDAVNMVGEAAHIHGAASGPGFRRHLPSMTREQRRHISNAIWLCATHADLIDGDEATYTADELRAMKREHEASCAERLRNASLTALSAPDLIAIGPETTFTGEFLGIEDGEWSFGVDHFVDGDIRAEPLADAPVKNWLPIRVDLEVKGLGRWQHELSICIPSTPVRRPSPDDFLVVPWAAVGKVPHPGDLT
jgi:hypothetical protein